MQDRAGRVWINTWGGGVCAQEGERFNRVPMGDLVNATAICETPDGAVWAGGFARELFRLKDGQFTTNASRQTGIRALFPDRQGRLWVGTYRNGIEMHDKGAITRWTTKEGLSSDLIFVLAQDAEGGIWIGTHNGLNRIRDGKIQVTDRRCGRY